MSKLFSNLILNSNAFLSLKKDFQSGCLAHSYLLVTPDSLGAKLAAQAFSLFCLGGDFKGLADFNADMHFVGNKATDIDAMLDGLLKRPSKADKKFYIISSADTLSQICQNKLLKTLEEPPMSVIIILCATSKAQIVAPILSRVRQVTLEPFSSYDIKEELKFNSGAKGDIIELASELSGGSLELANDFISDKQKPVIFTKVLAALKNTIGSKAVLGAVAEISPFKDSVPFIVGLYETILRDTLMLHLGVPALIKLKSHKEHLQELKAIYSINAIEKIMPFLTKMYKRKKANANHNSLVDELIFTVAKLRHEEA